MTRKSFLTICLISLGLPIAMATAAQANSYTLSDVSGTVEVRWHWFPWRRASEYERFGRGHRLRVRENSSVAFSCFDEAGDWKTWTASRSGEVPVYEYCAPDIRPDRTTSVPRSPSEEALPYVISPRNTALLSDDAKITWNAIPGASIYQVSIRGIDGYSWQSEMLSGAETVLPSNLEAGRTYEIEVVTDNGISSSMGGAASPTFFVLDGEEVEVINQQVAQIKASGSDNATQAIAISQLYSDYNLKRPRRSLNYAAISLLEAQIQQEPQVAALYQAQASLYVRVGLVELARQRYVEALDLIDESSIEQRAITYESLGRLAQATVDHAEAVRWLELARDIHQEHLDVSLPEAQERIDDIERLITISRERVPSSDAAQNNTH